MFNLKNDSKAQIGIDFLIELFIVGGIGLFIFMTLWNSTDSDIVVQINNLEGTFDAIILTMFFLIPVTALVRVIRFALKSKGEPGQE